MTDAVNLRDKYCKSWTDKMENMIALLGESQWT